MAATILIADDDAVQRRLVEAMVQKCGYEAVVVDSGDAAIAMLTAPEAPAVDAVVLEQAIRRAIELFEPRIAPASIEIEAVLDRSVLDMHNQISLVIRGLLWAQPAPLEIALRTQIDLEEGGITVTELPR